MSISLQVIPKGAMDEAVARLQEATDAKKCWGCGCLHGSLDAIEASFPAGSREPELDSVIGKARSKLIEKKYDCLGCEVCYPPLAMNALNVETEAACPSEVIETRAGWPPLPGSYWVLRYQAPVAVCTLTDEKLSTDVAAAAGPEVAMVGSVYTENLGIERIIQNTLANPHIRFLILCGPDSRQAIGHLPGQSLVSLAAAGTDDRWRIIGAKGKRPVLKNLSREAIEYFRKTVEVVDLIGHEDVAEVLQATRECAARNSGPAELFDSKALVSPIQGYIPERMVSDPAGYFVVYPDRMRGILSLEHYGTDGVLRHIIEGESAAELYIPAIEKGLVSRLDHAAYLGRELARAEEALRWGAAFTQDAAAERESHHSTSSPVSAMTVKLSACGCGSSC